jgi:hypothetical protein
MGGSDVEIRVRLPRVTGGLLTNLLGVLGLAAVVLAVGGLTGNWWWSVLVGGLFAVAVSYVANLNQAAEPAPLRAREHGVPERPLRSA